MTEKTDPQADRRLEQLEIIAKRNDRRMERAEEKEEKAEEKPKVEAKEERPVEPVAEAAPEIAPVEPEPAPVEPAIVKHKLKVNGRELELTTEELIARAQKVEAADQYLQEASRAFKETKSQEQPKAAPSVEEDDAALARAIQTGTEEEARNAIKKLRASQSPTYSQDDLLRMVDERLAAQEAARKFQTEFKDVFDDPRLLQLAMNEDARLTQNGDRRNYWDRFQEIGTNIRKWRDGFKSQPSAEEKQQRKASVTVLPTASARASTKAEEPEPTTQDVIREMAASRRGR